MSDTPHDHVEFDDLLALALAHTADAGDPSRGIKDRLMARVARAAPEARPGFSFRFEADDDWVPHPVPGIRMKVLALDRERDYATLLLDVAPGTSFPQHRHGGPEECYVVSGTLVACGRKIGPGDFHHADAGTDHGVLTTEDGCRVILVVQPEDYMPGYAS